MGDLNFRLLESYEVSPEEIDLMIQKGDISKLFEYDQLRSVMKSGDAFSELQEADPTFKPTFKYEVGKNYYDHKLVLFVFCYFRQNVSSKRNIVVTGGNRLGAIGYFIKLTRIITRT